MKNSKRKIFECLIFLFAVFIIGIKNDVNAEESVMASEKNPRLYDGSSIGNSTYFHYKYLVTSNLPAYCLNRLLDTPVGVSLTEYEGYSGQRENISAIIDAGNTRITKEDIPSTFKEYNTETGESTNGSLQSYKYFVIELALNKYLHPNNSDIQNPSVTDSTNDLVDEIAKTRAPSIPDDIKISKKNNTEQELEVDKDDVVDGYVKSGAITIELNQNIKFDVSAPEGIKIVDESNKVKKSFSNNEKFYILVPTSKIHDNSPKTITYTINASNSYTQYTPATIYTSGNSSLQNLAVYGGKTDGTKTLTKSYSLTIDFDTYATVKKVDKNTNRVIPGAKLQLLDSDKKEMSCELSDSNAKGESSPNCSWTTTESVKYILNLKEGTYYLKELSSPDGYTLKTNLQRVTVTKGSAVSVILSNEKNKITFSKKDATGKSELPGATLQIQDANGKMLYEWVSTSTPKVIEGMAPGKYYLVETIAPDGYALSKEKVEFEITATTATQTVTMSNKLNKVVISKKDATGKSELPGATLHVLDKDKKSMSCTILKDGKEQKLDKCTWVSGTKSVEIVGLKAGTYYLVETIAPEGYVLNKEKVEFKITDTTETKTVKMTNKLNKVVISKINAFTKKELPGATLEIQNEAGEIVKHCSDKEKNNECKWISTEEPYEIEGLPNGTYYLVETIAPKGFVLNKEKVKFTVDGKTAISYVQMKNELEVEVPDTLSSRSVLLVAISMFDIALGIGIINYVKKNKIKE